MDASPRLRRHVDEAIAAVNGEPGLPASFDTLHELLEAQSYRLAYWKTAAHEINYRRFFDVNGLAGLRVEDPEVFEATHTLLFELLQRGDVSGVRVDHPDGLFDPSRYVEMLQDLAGRARRADTRPDRRFFVVVEKILASGESIPDSWRVDGTTGYTFLRHVTGLFVDESGVRRLRRIYIRFTGLRAPFEDVAYESKRLIMDTSLASELNVLAHAIDDIGERNRKARDFTLNSLRDAIAEVVACFPVYRTYVTLDGWNLPDRRTIETAVRLARRRNPALEASGFEFLREVLLPRGVNDPVEGQAEMEPEDRRRGYPPASEAERRERLHVSMKFQQYTAPVQAKGIEDTAFYRYNVLLAANEVGGDPARPDVSPAAFHAANRSRRERFPGELLATATHDAKLGEDVRARLAVLSELTEEWSRIVSRWRRINKLHHTIVDGVPAPDLNDEYRLYQTLVGVWPFDPRRDSTLVQAGSEIPPAASDELIVRVRDYLHKSIKEAKVHTTWINENHAYDAAVARFVERTLTGAGGSRFLPLLVPFAERVARHGVVNSLAQVALKLTSPGVPDFYQGSELWDLSLVDPDNRRLVDFEHRARTLQELERLLTQPSPGAADLLASWPDGRIKLFLTASGLRLRQSDPDLFLQGDYLPLEAEVTVSAGIVAFARTLDGRALIAIAPRLTVPISGSDHTFPIGPDCWKTSRILLPSELLSRRYRNVLTGQCIEPTRTATQGWIFVGEALRDLPIGLLIGGSPISE
jgi:(1->4)-alpha-D-glucan 1-alpha-D-glucosylmutase